MVDCKYVFICQSDENEHSAVAEVISMVIAILTHLHNTVGFLIQVTTDCRNHKNLSNDHDPCCP